MLILRSRVLRQRKYFIFSIFTTFCLLVLILKQETSPALPLLQYVSVSPGLINIPSPADYDEAGCPRVPIAFSGMTGRLGNMVSTYVNFIALQWKLGYRYHLPQHSDSREYIQAWISLVEMVHSVAEGSLSAPVRKWTNGSFFVYFEVWSIRAETGYILIPVLTPGWLSPTSRTSSRMWLSPQLTGPTGQSQGMQDLQVTAEQFDVDAELTILCRCDPLQ